MRRDLTAVLLVLLALPVCHAQDFAAGDFEFLEDTVDGEVDVRIELQPPSPANADYHARIVFCYADPENHLYLDIAPAGVKLGEISEGYDQVLAHASSLVLPPGAKTHEITIKRRAWSIRVLDHGRTILHAYDAFAPGEKIGSAARGMKVADVYFQPIGDMWFHDDFARPPDEPDPWEAVAGSWKTALPDARNKRAEAAKSANPFSYLATGARALAVTGASFWDGYSLKTAVNPDSDGYVGLAFYVQGPKDFYLFRAPVAKNPAEATGARAELLRVENGNPTSVAQGDCVLKAGNWYSIGVTGHDGNITAELDGRVVCSAKDETFGEGRVGLYMEKCAEVRFDDVVLEPYHSFQDPYDPDGPMPVEQVTGTWAIREGQLHGQPDAQSVTAIGLTGCKSWENYSFDASVTAGSATSVGLFFGCKSRQDYYLFRWGPAHDDPEQDVQQLWKVKDGTAKIMTSRPKSLDRAAAYDIRATIDRSYLSVSVDGESVLDGVDLEATNSGQVGYYVEGRQFTSASFDDMRVSFVDPPKKPVSITEQFAKEDTMADWARPLASWKAMGSRTYAYTLPAWGDFDLRVKLKYFLGRKGTIGLLLSDNFDTIADAPDVLMLSSEKESGALDCTLAEGDSTGVAGTAEPLEDEPMLEVQRRGKAVVALLDGQPFAWTDAGDGVEKPFVGLKLSGVGINLNDATLTSPNIIDASFSGAPVEWAPQDGTWSISDRWNCQPQWSWFCGRDVETPLIWSKPAFTGDMVFEFWAAMMMDQQAGGGGGYSHPSDINGIICGDGQNLCSGYAFVFAGDNNTRSKIIRQGATVAESTAFRFANPSTSGNLNDFHRHWFHCRLERTGNHLTLFIDGKKALEYDDPEPLPGGNVGIWTHQNNGIMVARTRIAFKQTD